MIFYKNFRLLIIFSKNNIEYRGNNNITTKVGLT